MSDMVVELVSQKDHDSQSQDILTEDEGLQEFPIGYSFILFFETNFPYFRLLLREIT
jgi:hypothetical protein